MLALASKQPSFRLAKLNLSQPRDGVALLVGSSRAERFERFSNAPGVGAIGVEIRIEVGDRDSEEVRRSDERPGESDEFVPVEPQRLRVADSRQHAFIEYVEVQMEPRWALREPGGGLTPHPSSTSLAHLRRGA